MPKLDVSGIFSNAIDAIKYLNETTVDLILLDIHMPGFSGFDFIKTLKNPPAIIVTTSDKKFAFEAFEYDFIIDYLVKPIEPKRFEKAIRKVEASAPVSTKVQGEKEVASVENDMYVNIDRRLIKIDIQIC